MALKSKKLHKYVRNSMEKDIINVTNVYYANYMDSQYKAGV